MRFGTYRRRPAVGVTGLCCVEEPADGEGRAWKRNHHRVELAGVCGCKKRRVCSIVEQIVAPSAAEFGIIVYLNNFGPSKIFDLSRQRVNLERARLARA